MPWKRVLAAIALVLFLFLTVRAIQAHSYLGVILMFSANPATELLSVDLILSLTLISIWMVIDARKHGNSWIPFLELTFFFGIAGPLLYLVLRDFSIKVQRIEAIIVLLALGTYSLVTFPLADVAQPVSQSQLQSLSLKGQALMQKAADAHGLSAWQNHTTVSITGTDLWQAKSWWPTQDQRFDMHMLRGTFTSQVTLTDGPGMGETWGIQAWAPYRRLNEASPIKPVTGADPAITFYLPSLHYFAELPFRLLEAEQLIYQGQRQHRNQTYEVVLATWAGAQPHPEFDQYQVWINQQTQRIDMVHYTVRDAVALQGSGLQRKLLRSLALGTIHFEDYRQVNGVWIPHTHTVTLQPPKLTRYPLHRHFFHRLEIDDVRFDQLPAAALQPLPIANQPDDSKPAA